MDYKLSEKDNKVVVEVKISDVSDININPRKNGLIEENVVALSEAEFFPEIHLGLFDNKLIIIDGYHRFEATKRLGLENIKAYITKYSAIETLKKDAINENINHGQRLTDYDIAMSMFDLYKEVFKEGKLATRTIKDFISFFNIDERRGRALFAWVVIKKEILEDPTTKVDKVSLMEAFYSLIEFFNEKPATISNETKHKIKNFYFTYCDLNRNDLREAVKLFKEGKDFNEELDKKVKEEKDKVKLNEKTISESQNFSAGEEKSEEKTEGTERNLNAKNDLIQETYEEKPKETTLEEKMEEINKEFQKAVSDTSKNSKKIGITSYLENISQQLMTLLMLQKKNKLEELTKEHIIAIDNIEDRFEDLKEEYYQKNGKE